MATAMNKVLLLAVLAGLLIVSGCGRCDGNTKVTAPPPVINDDGFDMVFVEGGTFIMGNDNKIKEGPAHSVTLSNFYIGKYEVTQSLWDAVMGGNTPPYSNKDGWPVTRADWNDAQRFLAALNAKTGKKYRLPTEAEWEYAARGGDKSKGYRYAGSNNIDDAAWYTHYKYPSVYVKKIVWINQGTLLLLPDSIVVPHACIVKTSVPTHKGDSVIFHLPNTFVIEVKDSNKEIPAKMQPVGMKRPNELGIHDMSGNVWEWVSDCHDEYSSTAQINPAGPKCTAYINSRVYRGGSWINDAQYSRVSCRGFSWPDRSLADLGIRLVRDAP